MRWTFVPLLVSPYFIDVAWQILRWLTRLSIEFNAPPDTVYSRSFRRRANITTMRFNFLKVIGQNIAVSFPEAVRDDVVSNNVTITSSLHSDATIIRNKFSIFLV